jgi:hypothetical protein
VSGAPSHLEGGGVGPDEGGGGDSGRGQGPGADSERGRAAHPRKGLQPLARDRLARVDAARAVHVNLVRLGLGCAVRVGVRVRVHAHVEEAEVGVVGEGVPPAQ